MDDCCGSSEKIAAEFMAGGRPAPSGASTGSVLGGFEIKTPQEGKGFIEWAISGYSLDGCTKQEPAGVDYSPCGDWRFDKMTSATEYEK